MAVVMGHHDMRVAGAFYYSKLGFKLPPERSELHQLADISWLCLMLLLLSIGMCCHC